MKLWAYVFLAVFLILYGVMAITNVRVDFMPVILGFAALISGVLFMIAGVRRELN